MDPFELLGVAPGASPGEVRRAFAARARAVHPDVAGERAGAAEDLARLVLARDILLGRASASGRDGATCPPPPSGAPGPGGGAAGTGSGQVPLGALLVRAARRFVATWQAYDEHRT